MRQFLTGLLLISCTNFSCRNGVTAQHLSSDTTTQKFDTAKTKSLVSAKPEIFETSFFEGTEVKVNDTVRLTFYVVNIGKINLETGKVVACDPVMTYQQEPFTTQFPTGQFPVQLAIAKVNGNENELVGFSRILFTLEPVVKWEFALKKGQEPLSIFGTSVYYYSVDGGLGQFIDKGSFNRLEKLDQGSQLQVFDSLTSELDKHTRRSWQFANITTKGINMVSFSSGFGDGRYPTYVGYDRNDKPCRLLTDFGLVDWPKH